MPTTLKRVRNGLRLALGLDLEPGDIPEGMRMPCEVIRPPRHGDEKTFIVMGMPSGGTSMLAGVLSLMGINMGEETGPGNNEDQEFLRVVDAQQPLYDSNGAPIEEKFEPIRALVEKRNAAQKVWGWKDPHSINYVRQIMSDIRNPHVLVIFRDHMASAQSIKHLSGTEHLPTIRNYLRHMEVITSWIDSIDAPLMLISYERALRLRESLTRILAEFVDVEPTEEQIRTIMRYIRPDRGGANLDEVYLATDKAFWTARPMKIPKGD